jgi:hypothetical protein
LEGGELSVLNAFAESIFSAVAKALTSRRVAGTGFSLSVTLLERNREKPVPAMLPGE